jgi:hypothetical protein
MSDPFDLAEALRRAGSQRRSAHPRAATPDAAPAAMGPLVRPLATGEDGPVEHGATGLTLGPGLVILAGLLAGWIVLVAGLAGIAFLLIRILRLFPLA